jgi:methylated-DNA-[protein]-cysteine S-methyltransferase
MEEPRKLETELRQMRNVDVSAQVRSSLEAVAARAAEEGLVMVSYTTIESPVGKLFLAATPKGLVRTAFQEDEPDELLHELASAVSPAILEAPQTLEEVAVQLDQYFTGRRRGFEIPIDWSLTKGFQRRVLQKLTGVPYGRVTSYSELASRAGSSRAARAAGNALAANPIPVVVPCHRVIRSGGNLGGYGGGPERKQLLLELEGSIGWTRA